MNIRGAGGDGGGRRGGRGAMSEVYFHLRA